MVFESLKSPIVFGSKRSGNPKLVILKIVVEKRIPKGGSVWQRITKKKEKDLELELEIQFESYIQSFYPVDEKSLGQISLIALEH